jgi:hypothetical protein
MATDLNTITRDYLELLNLYSLMLDGQKGYTPDDSRWVDCQNLAVKLFFHASAIADLRQGTRINLASLDQTTFFYDFASVTVLARAALDCYLTLFEIFFEPASLDEFTFRHALWHLAGAVMHEWETVDPTDSFWAQKHAEANSYGQKLRETIRATAYFQGLSDKQQKSVLKGKRQAGQFTDRARAAGFGPARLQMVWDFHSGYVHSDGASATQVISAQTSEAQLEHIRIHMALVAMALGKTIALYASKFEPAKAIADAYPVAYVRAEFYRDMGEQLI